ncbi:MAG: phosphotransferase [Bacteroidetes bacterium]|nr:phosphotransferase [Fibrella sp.]
MKELFSSLYPQAIFVDYQPTPELIDYMRQQGWIKEGETLLSVEKPGEGNMNFVVRVTTDQQTFIVKQARPWVQKYPQVAAPIERVAVEATFYQQISSDPVLQSFVPKLKGYDSANFTLALEDLGAGGDFTHIYQKGQQLTLADLMILVKFISRLHTVETIDFPANTAMKALNHEHIFRFPFDDSTGFDLDTIQAGLMDTSLAYKRNPVLKASIQELGEVYLETGNTLLHGDYYPGSWLKTAAGVNVIDLEFGFMGRAEFDVGIMLAHLILAQNDDLIPPVLANYQKPPGFDESLMWGFAGVEILRRLLGLAQLPLTISLSEKKSLLEIAATLVTRSQ